MAQRSARTTFVITINDGDVKQYADLPARSAITAVDTIRYGGADSPIRGFRVTVETTTKFRYRKADGRWRR